MDRASMLNGDDQPSPGDVTLCIGCGHIMAFADDLSFRELTDQEIVAVAGDQRIVQAQALLASFKKSRGKS